MLLEMLFAIRILSFIAFIFFCLILANIIGGLYYSIGSKKQLFNWKKLLNGLFKGLAVLVSNYLLALALVAIPYAVADAGVNIEQELLQGISILILFLIWFRALIRYAAAVIEKVRDILDATVQKIE